MSFFWWICEFFLFFVLLFEELRFDCFLIFFLLVFVVIFFLFLWLFECLVVMLCLCVLELCCKFFCWFFKLCCLIFFVVFNCVLFFWFCFRDKEDIFFDVLVVKLLELIWFVRDVFLVIKLVLVIFLCILEWFLVILISFCIVVIKFVVLLRMVLVLLMIFFVCLMIFFMVLFMWELFRLVFFNLVIGRSSLVIFDMFILLFCCSVFCGFFFLNSFFVNFVSKILVFVGCFVVWCFVGEVCLLLEKFVLLGWFDFFFVFLCVLWFNLEKFVFFEVMLMFFGSLKFVLYLGYWFFMLNLGCLILIVVKIGLFIVSIFVLLLFIC